MAIKPGNPVVNTINYEMTFNDNGENNEFNKTTQESSPFRQR